MIMVSDDLVVGIVLTGQESALHATATSSCAVSQTTIWDGELWLNNSSFSLKLNQKGGGTRTVDTSVRKLLASRRQIDDLAARKKSGMSIIPTKLLTTGNYIKLIIALGRGKKLYDKRQTLKKRAEERDTRRTV
ncbi:MAG: SsrA-binding protein [Proteobacteria bacterium]|nr:SsrA-binding protein [Pseudomonadota bacterium]